MNKNEICFEISRIIAELFENDNMIVELDMFGSSRYDLPLTGKPFYFRARDLVYIIYKIEDEFGIKFTPEQMSSYGLKSISQIADQILHLNPSGALMSKQCTV